jgi:two-component system, NtrC family, response regulator AtoC
MQCVDASAVTVAAADGGESHPSSRKLLMVVGGGHFTTHPLEPGNEAIIGRDPTCELQLVHGSISRRHARIRNVLVPPGSLVVEDLGSRNGIVVGSRTLAAGAVAELRVGDSFRIGPFTVLVVGEAPPEPWATQAKIKVMDPTLRGLLPEVARLAESPVTILIEGETGCGKEVLARSLHERSRRPGPFVGLNVAALSDALLESELFGHERGAFTGAVRTKLGLLETARDGTVFLDEIGEMPLGLQAKLLRAIETREIYRVGSVKPIALSARFLAATHRDLEAEVAAGRFRHDLLYRLDGVTLQIPPLRERRGAIADLAISFLAEASAAAGRSPPRIGVDAIAKLVRHRWPGNVRELRAVIARSLLLCDGDELRASAILVDAMMPPASPEAFGALVRRHRGNVTEIARVLATSRSQVHRLAQRFGVALDQLREARPT